MRCFALDPGAAIDDKLSDPPSTRSGQSPHEGEFLSPEALPAAVADAARTNGWRAGLAVQSAHWDHFVTSHPEALLASIRSLPGEAFVEIPSLLVAVNYLQHVISSDDPRRFHDIALAEGGRADDESEPLDVMINSAGRTAGYRTSGRLADAVRSARQGRRILNEVTAAERAERQMELPHLLLQWGRSFEVADVGGVLEYEEAWELSNLTGQPLIARRAAASLAWLHAAHGRLNEAETWIARGRQITTIGSRYDAPLHLAAALVAIDRHDIDSIPGHLADLSTVPIGEYWAAETWVRAWAARTEPDIVQVETLLEAQRLSQPETLRRGGAFARYLAAAYDRLATIRGRNTTPVERDSDPSAFAHLMSALSAYRAGSMHAALDEAARALQEDRGPRLQSAAKLLAAAARLSLGRSEAAATSFTTAHAIIEIERLYSSYSIIAPAHLRELSESTGLPVHESADPAGLSATTGPTLASLSRRERQVLVHLASDLSLQAIADTLFVSKNTVKTTTSSLYRKLGVNSRQAAADIAQRAGIA